VRQRQQENPVSLKYPPGDWTRVPHDGKQMGSPLDQWEMVWMQWDCRLSAGLTPPPAAGLSHCRHDGLVTVRDEACLRQGHINDQSLRGHQCSKRMLIGESWFHISIPLEIEPGSLMTGSKRLVHRTSETWCECSEIAGSPHNNLISSACIFQHTHTTPIRNNVLYIHPELCTVWVYPDGPLVSRYCYKWINVTYSFHIAVL
jgi:hypothetical protein